ncbi:MAG: hypothetical protein ACXVPU_03155 [Bacteroidia bacterium]
MIGIGEKITTFTNLYFKEYETETLDGNSTLPDDYRAFLFHLLDKMVENFASIGQMMKLSEQEKIAYLKNSLYILLRSGLSDTIIACWLLDDTERKQDETEEDLLNRKTSEIKRDHLKFHVSYLNKMQSLGLLPFEERSDEIQIINSIYGHLLLKEIDKDLNHRSIEDSTTIKNMLCEVNKSNKTLVEAYKCYFLFSKIEHTGEFTRMITEKTYQLENPMDNYIENAIHAIESMIKSLVPLFFPRKEFIDQITAFKVIE